MGKTKWNKNNFIEEINRRMPESKIEIIEFNGIVKPFKFKCLKCGQNFSYTTADKCIDRARRGLTDACKNCEDTAQLTQRLKALKETEEKLKNSSIYPLLQLKKIKRISVPIQWKCKKCNQIFDRSIYNFLHKTSKCPYCEGAIHKYTKESFLKKMESLKIDNYDLVGDFIDANTRTLFRHKTCGFIWKTYPSAILAGHGCPKCKESRGEKEISEWLETNEIKFFRQYRFNDLKSYPFDFYIEYNNKKICVEFQGKQHYEPIAFFGGEEAFENQKKRDKIKKDYCLNNNIELIEIPYYKQKDIPIILLHRFNDQV